MSSLVILVVDHNEQSRIPISDSSIAQGVPLIHVVGDTTRIVRSAIQLEPDPIRGIAMLALG